MEVHGIYNTCQKCGTVKSAPWEAKACIFRVAGYDRTYHLCDKCQTDLVFAIEDAMCHNQPTQKGGE